MDIQDLRIDRFLIDIKNVYSRISFFFGDSDFSGEGSKQYREIKEAFSKAKEKLSNDIHLDRFNSETARQRVVSELNKAIELIKNAEPDVFPFDDKSADLSAAIVKIINNINTMSVDDN